MEDSRADEKPCGWRRAWASSVDTDSARGPVLVRFIERLLLRMPRARAHPPVSGPRTPESRSQPRARDNQETRLLSSLLLPSLGEIPGFVRSALFSFPSAPTGSRSPCPSPLLGGSPHGSDHQRPYDCGKGLSRAYSFPLKVDPQYRGYYKKFRVEMPPLRNYKIPGPFQSGEPNT